MSAPDKEQVIDPCGKCGHGLSEHNRDLGFPRSQTCTHGFGTKYECICYGWEPVQLVKVPDDAE